MKYTLPFQVFFFLCFQSCSFVFIFRSCFGRREVRYSAALHRTGQGWNCFWERSNCGGDSEELGRLVVYQVSLYPFRYFYFYHFKQEVLKIISLLTYFTGTKIKKAGLQPLTWKRWRMTSLPVRRRGQALWRSSETSWRSVTCLTKRPRVRKMCRLKESQRALKWPRRRSACQYHVRNPARLTVHRMEKVKQSLPHRQ